MGSSTSYYDVRCVLVGDAEPDHSAAELGIDLPGAHWGHCGFDPHRLEGQRAGDGYEVQWDNNW